MRVYACAFCVYVCACVNIYLISGLVCECVRARARINTYLISGLWDDARGRASTRHGEGFPRGSLAIRKNAAIVPLHRILRRILKSQCPSKKKISKNAASVPLHRTHTHTHTHTHTLTHTHTHTHTHNTHTVDCAAFPEVSALVNKKLAKIQPVYPSTNSLCPGTFTFFFLNPPFRIFHNTDAAIVFRIRSMHIENTFFYI